jgi:nucleoside-diphosphate-sugar epimerase
LALDCLSKGHSVLVVGQENNSAEARNSQLLKSRGAEVVISSVTDRKEIFRATRDTDLVFHLAAAQHEANVPDQRFWDVNVTGTRNVLEASKNSGVKRFIHGSTIGVYGSAVNGKLDERSPTNPDNIYGITKLEGERLVRSFQGKIPTVIIRITETYGPGDQRLLKLFRSIKKGVFLMIGKGENIHHLIYVDDLINGLHLSATTDRAIGEIVALAGKEPLTTNQMVATIANEMGRKISRWRVPLPPFLIVATILETTLRPLGIQPPIHRRRMDFFRKSFEFSLQHSRRVLNFQPEYDFKWGVSETAKWYTEMGFL